MPISAFSPKFGHTFCYIRKQITIDISRDIPTFHQPSIGTLMMTSIGISHLFAALQLSRKQCHPLGYPNIFVSNIKGHFSLHLTRLPSFLQTITRDTSCDTPSMVQKKPLRLEIILKPEPTQYHARFYPQTLGSKNSPYTLIASSSTIQILYL